MYPRWWTVGAVADHFGVEVWQVRRLFLRGFLPEPGRVGIWRVMDSKDLPKVEKALREAGYLPKAEAKAEV